MALDIDKEFWQKIQKRPDNYCETRKNIFRLFDEILANFSTFWRNVIGGSYLSRDLYYIDTETGEIEPFVGTVITEEQRKIIHAKKVRQLQYNDGPAFIWAMFRYGD